MFRATIPLKIFALIKNIQGKREGIQINLLPYVTFGKNRYKFFQNYIILQKMLL